MAHAYEVKHSDSGDLVRWHGATVPLALDRSIDEVPGAEAAVTAAVAAWSKRGGGPTIEVVARHASREPGLDGTNVVFYDKDGFEPATGDVLAVTVLSYDADTGNVLDADIVLNGKYQLGVVDPAAKAPTREDQPGAETFDIGRVVAHEMGHVLALGDELGLESSLMYPYVPRARALEATPVNDDLSGLETLYTPSASPSDTTTAAAHGCAGATVARTGSRDLPGGMLAAAGLCVGAIVMARSRKRSARGIAGCGMLMAAVMAAPNVIGATHAAPSVISTTPALDEIQGVVTGVTATATRGLFRSELDVCDRGACSHVRVWGGTVEGVRQVIGGTLVPKAGERVRISLQPVPSTQLAHPDVTRVARTVTRVVN